MGYAIDEWIVAWNPAKTASGCRSSASPGSGEVEVGPNVPGQWADRYEMSSGACSSGYRKMSAEGKAMLMFVDFHKLVVRDRLDPQAVHREFLKIDEYRRRVGPDVPGAI